MTNTALAHIRVKLPGESFWACTYLDLPANQAEINNVPLTEGFNFGDRIEFDEDRNVTRVVKTRAEVSAELAANYGHDSE